jgi:hypothetical protein
MYFYGNDRMVAAGTVTHSYLLRLSKGSVDAKDSEGISHGNSEAEIGSEAQREEGCRSCKRQANDRSPS